MFSGISKLSNTLFSSLFSLVNLCKSGVASVSNSKCDCQCIRRNYGQFRERRPFLPPDIRFAISVFERDQFAYNQPVQKLLKSFRKTQRKLAALDKKKRKKKYALIAFEGLDGCGKSAVGKRVAFRVGAEYRISPPDIIKEIRPHFEDATLRERAAYYTIGNYIVAMQLTPLLSRTHVILDRYWHSTSAFHIAEAVRRDVFFPMPEAGDKIYRWPRDLLKPDMVIFFNVTEELRVKRHCSRGTTNTNQEQLLESNPKFRMNVLKAYDRMFSPHIVKINADPPIPDVVAAIEKTIYPVLDYYERKLR